MEIKQMTISLPPHLAKQAQDYIQKGWFNDWNSLVSEALQRYFDTHKMDINEKQIWEDVQWGIHGKD